MEGTQLVITKMILHNFKSFYGTKIISGFHPQFTCIIGPNGSGKSNLIDAILFVFGYRAKQIRQSKLIGLIHNSALHPNVKECHVTINFARVNSEHAIIPGTEFSIKRDVNVNGNNNYYMNSTKVKREEITAFLLREGVDFNNNRFLILQGEVRNISLMKPMATNQNQVGFLEYIEEIIGSNKYIQDIKEVEADLATKNEERDQLAKRLNVSQNEVEALSESHKEAQDYLKLQAKINIVDAKICHTHGEDVSKSIEKIESEIGDLQKTMDEQKEEISKREAEIKKTHSQVESKEKELEKVKPKLNESRAELDALVNDETRLSTEKEGSLKILEDCKNTYKTSNDMVEASKKVIEIKSKEKEDIQKEIEINNQNLDKARQELEEKTKEVKGEIEILQQDLQASKERFAAKNDEFLQLESQVTQAQDEIDAIERKVEESQKMKADKTESLKKMVERVDQLKQMIPERKQRIENETKKYDELHDFIINRQENLHNLQEEAKKVAVNLNEMMRLEAEGPGSNKLHKCIMEFKAREQIGTIYGRLRELAQATKEKYNNPLDFASGNKLDFIVVQSADDADMCIEELARQNAGYGTFIVLDEQEKHRKSMQELIKKPDPPQAQLLLRKLKFHKEEDEEKFMPAFYYVFRDTLVADNLEIATQVRNKYGRRVVTMKGDIVEKSGVMSGGGKPVGKGGMAKVSKEKIKQEKEKLDRYDDEIKQERQKIESAKSQLQMINVDSIQLEVKKFEFDLQQSEQQILYIEDQLSKMVDCVQSEEDKQKINSLRQFIDDNRDDLALKRKEVESLRSKSQEIENKIKDIVDIRTKTQKEEIAKLEDTIDDYRKRKAKIEAAINGAQRKIDKNNKIIEENEKTEKKTQNELEVIETKLQSTKEKEEKKKEEVEKFKKEVKDKEKEIDELKKTENESKTDVNELKVESEKTNAELKKKTADLKVLQKELNAINSEFERLGIQENEFGEFDSKSLKELQTEKAAYESQLKEMNPDLSVIKEYEEKQQIYEQFKQQFADITNLRNEIALKCQDLKQKRLTMFTEGFTKIAAKLKETYQILTLGGDADLELVDDSDPFSQGINFSVRPPGKSWKLITNLSGGEQTLSSLSLIFSLHQFKPTPFYVMDEIDAALDYRNVSIIANYLKERTTKAQFIVVSLRNHMFELADRLVGIFKVNDCASAITIDIDEERKVDGEEQNPDEGDQNENE